MAIKTPLERVYYQISSKKFKRIFLWIPRNILNEFVIQDKADSSILIDYPDGLDIELTNNDFKDFKDLYGLKLNVFPRIIQLVFEFFLQEKIVLDNKYLNGDFLEILTGAISGDEYEKIVKMPKFDSRRFLKKNKNLYTLLEKEFKRLSLKERTITLTAFPENEPLFNIKMKVGKNPFEEMYRLQRKQKRRS